MTQDDAVSYKVKIKNVERVKNQDIVIERVPMIFREINVNGNIVDIPSPFSIYAIDVAGTEKLNTRRAYANVFCGFLNYIQKEVHEGNDDFKEIKSRGIYALKWEHACSYLQYCIKELKNSRDTVKYKMSFMKKLYQYLIEEGVLNKNTKFKTVFKYNYKLKKYTKSMEPQLTRAKYRVKFPDEVNYSSKQKLKDLDEGLWLKFLEISKKIHPEIRLGIYIQLMGGLRAGELVNLTLDSLNIENVSYPEIEKEFTKTTVDIRNRNNELFDRDVRLDSCQTKKQRDGQIVLDPMGMFNEIYEEHLAIINEIKKKSKSKYTNALFLNAKGEPMTGSNYGDRFYKVKREFLNYLEEHSYADYVALRKTKWGTHIGRGVYTNFIINNDLAVLGNGEVSPRLVADLRGDSSEESAREYVEKSTIIKNIMAKQSELYKKLKEKQKGLDTIG